MTIAPDKPETRETPVPEGHVKLVIDGEEVIAPKGELLIRTAERRFCPAAINLSADMRQRVEQVRPVNQRQRHDMDD